MVEVFITDIENKNQAGKTIRLIQSENEDLEIAYDLNETDFSFPCGHTVLRVEGKKIDSEKIMTIVKAAGFNCDLLEDKICIKQEEL